MKPPPAAGRPAGKHSINVRFERCGLRRGRGELELYVRSLLGASLDVLGWKSAEVNVLFCSDLAIRRLNRTFREEDKATDVLSFPASEKPRRLKKSQPQYLGDLAIALPYTMRQARSLDRPLEDEVALLLVHGLLHLVGEDHDTRVRKARMDAMTERLLEAAAQNPCPELTVQ